MTFTYSLPIFVNSANLEVPRMYLVHNDKWQECTNTLIRILLVCLFSPNILGYSPRIYRCAVLPLGEGIVTIFKMIKICRAHKSVAPGSCVECLNVNIAVCCTLITIGYWDISYTPLIAYCWSKLKFKKCYSFFSFSQNFVNLQNFPLWALAYVGLNLADVEGDSTGLLLFWPNIAGWSLQCVDAHYCIEEKTSDLSTFLVSHGQYAYTNGPKLEFKTWHSLFDLQVHVRGELYLCCQKTKSASSLPFIFEIRIFWRAVCSDHTILNFGALFPDHMQNISSCYQ